MGAELPIRMPLAIKRGERRARLTVQAVLLAAGCELPARLRDMSRTGALAEAAHPPRQGSEVVLACAGMVVPATVAWVIGRRFGLEFHRPIAKRDVALMSGGNRLG